MPCPLVCFNVLQIEHSSTAIKVDIHAWLHVAQFKGGITCTSCSSVTTCHTKGHQHKIELDYQLTIISYEHYTLLEHMQSHRLQRVCKSMLGYYVPCMCPMAHQPTFIMLISLHHTNFTSIFHSKTTSGYRTTNHHHCENYK